MIAEATRASSSGYTQPFGRLLSMLVAERVVLPSVRIASLAGE